MKEPGITPKEVLDFDEAAAFLGVSTKTFAKVLRTEELPGRKVGREWRFSKHALLAWLASGSTRHAAADDEEPETDGRLPGRTLRASPPPPAERSSVRSRRIEGFSAEED